MKVAVTSSGPDLDSQVDARFGRCAYFLIVELDDMSFEALQNPNATLGGGAGIQSAQMVATAGAGVVLTGNCGPKAFSVLSSGKIDVVVGVSGGARQAVEDYKEGKLSATGDANVEEKFGMVETIDREDDSEWMRTERMKPSWTGRRSANAWAG